GGGPELGAVHDVVVARARRGGAQRDEVAAGLGLREALTPEHVTRGNLRQVEGLLRLAAVLHDRGADPVHVHVLRAARLADAPHLLGEERAAPGRGVGAAVRLGPALGEPAAARERAAELAREGGL